MGADEKKQKKKRQRVRKEPLSEKQKDLLAEAGTSIDDALGAMEEAGQVSREFSLVRTKLEEAEMWMERGFEALGYELDPGDDEPDDDEPGGDEDDEPEDEGDGDEADGDEEE